MSLNKDMCYLNFLYIANMKKPKMKITHENGQEFIKPVVSIHWWNNEFSNDIQFVMVDFIGDGVDLSLYEKSGDKFVNGLFTGELILT